MADLFNNHENLDSTNFRPEADVIPDSSANYGEDYVNATAGMTAQLKTDGSAAAFNVIKENIQNTGTDPLLEQVRQESVDKQGMEADELSNSILTDSTMEPVEKLDLMSQVEVGKKNIAADISAEFIETNIENATSNTPEEELAAVKKQGTGSFLADASRQLQKNNFDDMLRIAGLESGDPGVLTLIADVAEYVALPGQQGVYQKIFGQASPAFSAQITTGDWVDVGNVKRKFKEYTNTLTTDERILLHKDVLIAVNDNMGVVSDDNRIERMFIGQEITDLMDPLQVYSQTERTFDGFIGFLDAWPVGSFFASVIKRGYGIGRNMRTVAEGSNISNMNRADPVGAKKLADDQIANPGGDLEKGTGATSVDIIDNNAFPTAAKGRTPEGFDINRAKENQKTIYGKNTDETDYEANKIARQDTIIDKFLNRLSEKNPRVHISKSRTHKVADGINYEVVVGQTDTVGFQTLSDAHDAARGFSNASDGYRVMGTNQAGDLVDEADLDLADLGGIKDYYVEFKTSEKYKSSDLFDIGDGLEGKNSILVDNGLTGSKAKFSDPSSVFIPNHIRKISEAVNQAARFSKGHNELLEPFVNLKKTPWKQTKILSEIQKGEEGGYWLEGEDLLKAFNEKDDLIRGYEAFRRTADVVYLEQNFKLFKDLSKKGYVDLHAGDFHTVAKPLNTEAELSEVEMIFDLETQGYRSISSTEKARLGTNNLAISRNLDLMSEVSKKDGKLEGTYFVLHKVDNLSELPPFVLNYKKGYVPRMYESPYKVVMTNPDMRINGKTSEGWSQAVGFAPTRGSAVRMSAGQTKIPGAKYTPQKTRELMNATEDFDTSYDLQRAHGRMYFSKRGEELPGLNGERSVGNITDSMSRMIASVTKNHALGDIVDDLKDNWLQSYRKFNTDPKAGFPMSRDAMTPPVDLNLMESYDAAVATMERINHIHGQNAGLGVKAWRTGVSHVADMVEGSSEKGLINKFRNHISKSLLDPNSASVFTGFMNINRTPLSALKAATFVKVIALNPLRQMMINTAQMTVYAGVDGGGKYMLSTFSKQGWFAEHSMLLTGMSTRRLNPKARDLIRETTLKMVNTFTVGGKKLTLKDLDDLTEDFHSSGLMQNIDGHQFLTATATDRADSTLGGTKFQTVGRYAKEYLVSAPINIGKQGFIKGEALNISTAWLVARNGVRQGNAKALLRSPENLSYMSGRASEISYNMNRSGEIAYQKGALSGFFQFMSVQQKAAQALLPTKAFGKTIGKVAGKQFSGEEKAKIALIQTGLFGTAGLGLTELYTKLVEESDIELSPEFNSFAKGAIVDYMVNGIGEIATGEVQTLKVSAGLAPIAAVGSAAGMVPLVGAALEMSKLGLQWTDLLGASKNLVGQSAKLMETMHYVGLLASVDASTQEDWDIVIEDSLSLFSSGMSNYNKAMLYTNLGREYTSNGIAKFPTTPYEQWGKALFGLQNGTNQDVNDLVFKTIKKGVKFDDTARGRVESQATMFYNMLNKFAVRKADGDLHEQKFKETMRAMSLITNLSFGPGEKAYFQEFLTKKLISDDRLTGGELRLTVNLIEAMGNQWMGSKSSLMNALKKRDVRGEFTKFIELVGREVPEAQ